MIEINRNPTRKELVVFGLLLGPFCALVGWLLRDAAPGATRMLWFAAVPVTLVGGALAAFTPELMRRFYVAWMIVVYPIGWTVSHVIMAIVYYVVLTPLGFIMRLSGYDPMRQRIESDATTYWIKRESTRDPKRYFRQF
jgi:hypothetical protein